MAQQQKYGVKLTIICSTPGALLKYENFQMKHPVELA